MAKKTETVVLDLPVAFSNVTIGDETARVGITIDRKDLPLGKADQNLCGRRLTGRIIARLGGSSAGPAGSDQQSLPGADDDPVVEGTFDVKSFNVKKKVITAGLTFSLDNLDVAELGRFAKRNGKFTVTAVDSLPDKPLPEPGGAAE